MATFSQKDIQLLFIGAAATKTTGGISAMNDGEIGIFTPAGARVTEATAATIDKFIIVKKTANSGVPLVSGIINKNNIKLATRKVYTAATEEVVNLGYNGSAGAIEAINDNHYHIRISLRQGRTSNHGGLYLKHAFYESDLNATQAEIASTLVANIRAEFSKEPDPILKAEALCNDAGAAITVAAGADLTFLSFVNGSKYVTGIIGSGGSPALGTDEILDNITVGDYLRVGTATTAPVYLVVANTPGTATTPAFLTLNSAYVGTSTDIAYGSTEVITAANAATANFGIKLTGIAQAYKVGKLDQDLQPNIFDVTLENFGTTQNVVTTMATAGNGTEKQIKALEFFAQGNEGDFLRMGEPLTFDRRVEASGNYDLIDIVTQEIYADSIVAGPINKVYTLAIPASAPDYAIAATADDITDVLEILAGTATDALAVS
jgi:hypothetical protein